MDDRAAHSERITRLMKWLRLQRLPGVLTASMVMVLAIEFALVMTETGLRTFALSQLGLVLIVVAAVALVDAGRIWDPLFDHLYRPAVPSRSGRAASPSGRFMDRERPWGGLFPSSPALACAREAACTALAQPDRLYDEARKCVCLTPDGDERWAVVAEPLELSKGLRALLAPLVALFAIGVVVAGVDVLIGGANLGRWSLVAGASAALWLAFAYVFVQQRYRHVMLLYAEVLSVTASLSA